MTSSNNTTPHNLVLFLTVVVNLCNPTTTIPAQLIKKYDCAVVPIYIERNKENCFKMYISKPIKLDKSKTINQITLYLNNILEKMILKNVDQWIWSHDRWKG